MRQIKQKTGCYEISVFLYIAFKKTLLNMNTFTEQIKTSVTNSNYHNYLHTIITPRAMWIRNDQLTNGQQKIRTIKQEKKLNSTVWDALGAWLFLSVIKIDKIQQ